MKSRIINKVCSKCGACFSVSSGHSCNEDYVEFRKQRLRDNCVPISELEWVSRPSSLTDSGGKAK